jgi:mono/diheme cytochrome c family protein
VALGVTALAAVGLVVAHGISTRPEPSRFETRAARAARRLLIPAADRRRANPVAATPTAIAAGRAHFADHCAVCHGNDGKGRTQYGRRLSPRSPDMTLPATQELSDGELFWIIENGVRHSGMPGFGDDDPSNDAESWELVHFVRTLPRIGAGELSEMERLNPALSRADVERERENEEFLSGGGVPPEQRRP